MAYNIVDALLGTGSVFTLQERSTLLAIARCADKDTWMAYPSQFHISWIACNSRSSVNKSLGSAKQMGVVHIASGGGRHTNLYRLNFPLFCAISEFLEAEKKLAFENNELDWLNNRVRPAEKLVRSTLLALGSEPEAKFTNEFANKLSDIVRAFKEHIASKSAQQRPVSDADNKLIAGHSDEISEEASKPADVHVPDSGCVQLPTTNKESNQSSIISIGLQQSKNNEIERLKIKRAELAKAFGYEKVEEFISLFQPPTKSLEATKLYEDDPDAIFDIAVLLDIPIVGGWDD